MNQLPKEPGQVIEVSLKWLDVLSLFTGIASLVLAIIAIWLSFKFYQMSTASSDKINESSGKINNNVEKLEKMFDTMYADTFSMVKDTVTHMRKQVDRKVDNPDFFSEVGDRINELVSEQLKDLPKETLNKDDVKTLIQKVVKESKEIEIEVEKQSMEEHIIKVLKKEGEQTYSKLKAKILGSRPSNDLETLYFDTLYNMSQKGIIEDRFLDDEEGISIPISTIIKIKTK